MGSSVQNTLYGGPQTGFIHSDHVQDLGIRHPTQQLAQFPFTLCQPGLHDDEVGQEFFELGDLVLSTGPGEFCLEGTQKL